MTMTYQPLILEIGTGIDLHGHNATEAARRAVWNAVHQSSLMGLGLFGPDTSQNMVVEVTIAISRPDEVDEETVLADWKKSVNACSNILHLFSITARGPGRLYCFEK